MKPREFDDLIRHKFDQNDFEYNPAQWDELAVRLGGNDKKRTAFIVWLMPLLSMAASITVALAIPTIVKMAQPGSINRYAATQISPNTVVHATEQMVFENNGKKANKNIVASNMQETDGFRINAKNALVCNSNKKSTVLDLLAGKEIKKKKTELIHEPVRTFKEEALPPVAKFSVTLLGGMNYGSQNNGYIIGATTRRMISDKMFIESDVAFISTGNAQQTAYYIPPTTSGHYAASVSRTTGTSGAARTTTTAADVPTANNNATGTVKDGSENYNSYYAQIAPGIGWKLSRKFTLGGGPDFQEMLSNNRPAVSSYDRNNVAVAPMFDVGVLGKTEYAVSKKLKAAMYYRKGMNNFLTPMDKYSDRDYMQFQLRYTLLNR